MAKTDPSTSAGRPQIMGILNVTPDSFSDGGRHDTHGPAVRHGLAMAGQGADIIDVGGESTRPGARRISSDEQIARVRPVIQTLRQRLDETYPGVRISIDTTRAEVAEAAIEAGASILNDVSAGREDPGVLSLAAQHGLTIILMHMQGEPGTMQDNPTYTDVAAEVRDFLLVRARAAEQAGVRRDQIVLDPGIGFGKTTEHNLTLLRALPDLVAQGYPVMVGASRKRFISEFSGPPEIAPPRQASEPASGAGDRAGNPKQGTEIPGQLPGVGGRLGGTCAISVHCVYAGVNLLRVHDVAANRQAVDLAWALRAT